MMYEKVLQDYSQRAYDNYKENVNTENNVTLLICSFTGVMAMLDDKIRKKMFKDISYEKVCAIVSPDKNELYEAKDGSNKTLALYRHFRNTLCHIKMEEHIRADDNNQIESIRFEDYYQNQQKFDCTLTIDQLRNFFEFTVDLIQQNKDEK